MVGYPTLEFRFGNWRTRKRGVGAQTIFLVGYGMVPPTLDTSFQTPIITATQMYYNKMNPNSSTKYVSSCSYAVAVSCNRRLSNFRRGPRRAGVVTPEALAHEDEVV